MNRIGWIVVMPVITATTLCHVSLANDETPDTMITSTDQEFVKEAAEVNAFETEASEIALKQSTRPDVKSYAQAMARDYSKANGELVALAGRKNIDISQPLTTNDQGLLRRLAALRGADFDSSYAKAVAVGVHVQAVSLFKVESTAGSDPEIKTWAARTLPTLQQHLQVGQHLKANTADDED